MQDDPRRADDEGSGGSPDHAPVPTPGSDFASSDPGDAPTEVVPLLDSESEVEVHATTDSASEATIILGTPADETTMLPPATAASPEATTALPAAESVDVAPTPGAVGNAAAPIAATEATSSADEADHAAGAPRGTTGRRPRRRGLWIALALSALLLVALIGYLIWDSVTRLMREEAITATAQTYLDAVANSDADAALATLDQQPSDTTLLTNEVLTLAHEDSPVTNPTVGSVAVTDTTARVAASYALGGEQVDLTLLLVGDGRTTWHISDGVSSLALTGTDALTVNGATVDQQTYPVLPGTYTMAPTSDLVTLGEATSVVVTSPEDEAATLSPEYDLSTAGAKAVQKAVKDQFTECLAATVANPTNCPFGLDPGKVKIKKDSVKYDLTNNPWKDFTAQLDPATLTATGTFHFTMDVTATVTQDGLTAEGTVSAKGDPTWTIDLTQDPLAVTWS